MFAASAVTRTCVAWPVPDFSGSGSFLCSATTLGNVSLAARYGSFAFAANVSLGGFGTTISILLPKNPNFPLTQQSLPLAQPNLLPTRSISPMRKGHSRNTHTVPNGRSDSERRELRVASARLRFEKFGHSSMERPPCFDFSPHCARSVSEYCHADDRAGGLAGPRRAGTLHAAVQ